jgi:hypothetical protein
MGKGTKGGGQQPKPKPPPVKVRPGGQTVRPGGGNNI